MIIVWDDKQKAFDWLMRVRSKPTSRNDATALALKMGAREIQEDERPQP